MTVRSRILLVFLLTQISGFFALERWLSLELRPRYYQSFEEPLVDMANVLAEIAAPAFNRAEPDFAQFQSVFQRVYQRHPNADIYGMSKHSIDVRVYITDLNGIVIFDTENQDIGKDFSAWRDVYLTLNNQYGARSTPVVDSIKQNDEREARSIAYVAAPIYKGKDIVGVLTVGKPKVNITQMIQMAHRDLFWLILVVAVLALIAVTLIYLWLSRPLYQVAGFAKAIAKGETLATPDFGRNEIGSVVDAIVDMRQALDGKQYIERYTQTLAHELKSPLTSIQASAELLLEQMPEPQRIRFIKNIQNENERALNLIQRLLELAAVENRYGKLEKQDCSLTEIIKEIETALQTALAKKQLALSLAIENDLQINAERFLLKQALLNVIDNAIAFSPIGGKITIKAVSRNNQTSIIIQDQGPGIPDYARDKIFDRFYSLPRPDGQYRSSGIGLSFVKEVMELHQGRICLTSDSTGTKAILIFPG